MSSDASWTLAPPATPAGRLLDEVGKEDDIRLGRLGPRPLRDRRQRDLRRLAGDA